MKEGITINHYGESHFYDGATQYGDITINNPVYNKNYSSKETEGMDLERAEQEEGKNDDPLRMFLKNKEDYDYVLEWAKLCKSPKDINNSIVLPLKKKGYGLEITTNPPFLKELIPHLTNFETSMNVESISRALRK